MKKLICTILLGTALVGSGTLAATDVTVKPSGGVVGVPVAADENPLPKEGTLASIPYFGPGCLGGFNKTLSADERETLSRVCRNYIDQNPYTAYIYDKKGNLVQKIGLREGIEYSINGFDRSVGSPKKDDEPFHFDGRNKDGRGWIQASPMCKQVIELLKSAGY